MHGADRLYFSKFSLNADFASFFEKDDLQDWELDGETNDYLDATNFDETDDYFWD